MRLSIVNTTCVGIVSSLLFYSSMSMSDSHATSKYAGQEIRNIKSLSADDIKELSEGTGWGLAKTAELNGVPGPIHLLEIKDEIGLDRAQIEKVERLYTSMKTKAIEQGMQLIESERELEERFKSNIPSADELEEILAKIGRVRSALRFTHLQAHLETPNILTAEQISLYNRIRGYENPDPCTNIPEGHSVKLWKKHNGCQ